MLVDVRVTVSAMDGSGAIFTVAAPVPDDLEERSGDKELMEQVAVGLLGAFTKAYSEVVSKRISRGGW